MLLLFLLSRELGAKPPVELRRLIGRQFLVFHQFGQKLFHRFVLSLQLPSANNLLGFRQCMIFPPSIGGIFSGESLLLRDFLDLVDNEASVGYVFLIGFLIVEPLFERIDSHLEVRFDLTLNQRSEVQGEVLLGRLHEVLHHVGELGEGGRQLGFPGELLLLEHGGETDLAAHAGFRIITGSLISLTYNMYALRKFITPALHLLPKNRAFFSQADNKQTLKTFLEIIPPARMYEIMGHKRISINYLAESLGHQPAQISSGQVALQEKQLKMIFKKIKNQGHLAKVEDLMEVMQVVDQAGTEPELVKKINNRIIEIFRKKLNFLSLESLIDFVYKMVKLNHKNFDVMKQVEKILIEEKIKADFPMIRKALWAYTHLDVGSTVLYSHLCKTLKIAQHEFSPLELAEAAYMLSKVSENATGGFGIFQIAERHVESHLSRLNFHELVRASSYLLAQNIGKNQFQLKLEEALYNKYPDKASLRTNDLVDLLKATSSYYFKFKQNALLYMLKTSTNRMAPHATLQQFEDMIWSWGRSGKGDKELWENLQSATLKFLPHLKPRQTAFFYYSLCCSKHSSNSLLEKLQKHFMQLLTPQTNEHYLIKMLLGMQKRKDFSSPSFLKLTCLISERISQLSNRQLMAFTKTLNESDLHYENKYEQLQGLEQTLTRVSEEILKKIYLFGPHQMTELLYMWIKLDIKDPNQRFTQSLLSQLDAYLLDIPKQAFIKAMFCFTIKEQYEVAIRMLPILYQLMKYGPIGYFFSPYETPLLCYCVFHMVANSQNTIKVHPQLIEQLKMSLDNTTPEMLNDFIKKGYAEALNLSQKI